MLGWLILIGIFVVPGLIGWAWEKYQEYVEAERSKVRDEVASNLVAEYGLSNEVVDQVERYSEFIKKSLPGRLTHSEPLEFQTPTQVQRQSGRICSKCHTGLLVRRQGKYGYFLGCTNYPRCTNTQRDTMSNKRARDAEKEAVAKSFLEDLEKAYS